MNPNACYCGLKAHAYCTRCGAALCFAHHDDPDHRSVWLYRNWGGGKQIGEAAYVRGYWMASRDRILCRDCRHKDGEQHAAVVLQQSREWPQDPFRFALKAASLGYVLTEPGISYAQAVQSWLDLNWKPVEVVTTTRITQAEKGKWRGGIYRVTRPAQYAHDNHAGWSFPRTILQSVGHSTPQEDDPQRWSGTTDILTDGRVFHAGQPATRPLSGAVSPLILEMARKMHITRGWEWKGPGENWG